MVIVTARGIRIALAGSVRIAVVPFLSSLEILKSPSCRGPDRGRGSSPPPTLFRRSCRLAANGAREQLVESLRGDAHAGVAHAGVGLAADLRPAYGNGSAGGGKLDRVADQVAQDRLLGGFGVRDNDEAGFNRVATSRKAFCAWLPERVRRSPLAQCRSPRRAAPASGRSRLRPSPEEQIIQQVQPRSARLFDLAWIVPSVRRRACAFGAIDNSRESPDSICAGPRRSWPRMLKRRSFSRLAEASESFFSRSSRACCSTSSSSREVYFRPQAVGCVGD